jgi:hypothetical protein
MSSAEVRSRRWKRVLLFAVGMLALGILQARADEGAPMP